MLWEELSVSQEIKDPVAEHSVKHKYEAFTGERVKYDGVKIRTKVSEQHYDKSIFIMQEWEGHVDETLVHPQQSISSVYREQMSAFSQGLLVGGELWGYDTIFLQK